MADILGAYLSYNVVQAASQEKYLSQSSRHSVLLLVKPLLIEVSSYVPVHAVRTNNTVHLLHNPVHYQFILELPLTRGY